jgi:hypothetical protein
MHHDEIVHQRIASVVEEEDDRSDDDRMDETLDAIWSELETQPEDPPTPEVQKFFNMLRASEESLHEHTTNRPHFRDLSYKHQIKDRILKQMLQGALKPFQRCPS